MPSELGTPDPARRLSRASIKAARTCGVAANASRANAAGIEATVGAVVFELGRRAYARADAVIEAVICAASRKGARSGGILSVSRKASVFYSVSDYFFFAVSYRMRTYRWTEKGTTYSKEDARGQRHTQSKNHCHERPLSDIKQRQC
jgi:hypothetical protein